jgi:hypothetical protein
MRIDWTSLPEAVMTGVGERVGGIDAIPASSGEHAEIAATVAGDKGKVFVKAASSGLGVRSLRYELGASKAVNGPYSPTVEWDFETAGWLVVGFEHVDGPHADLSPGSPDLDLLDATLKELAETPAAGGQSWFSPAGRLGFAHPAMDGETLVHTDLNPANLIVSPHGLRVVDWAFATKAAPWVELALLVQWLIGGGHTPQQAEEWLARRPAWGATSPEVLDHFASSNAAKWSLKAEQNTAPWVHDLSAWTGEWSTYRRTAARKQRG